MKKRAILPMNTLVDKYGKEEGLPADAIALMKAFYLGFEPMKKCAEYHGWSDTRLIDAAETLRRQGAIKLLWNPETETIALRRV